MVPRLFYALSRRLFKIKKTKEKLCKGEMIKKRRYLFTRFTKNAFIRVETFVLQKTHMQLTPLRIEKENDRMSVSVRLRRETRKLAKI